MRRAFFMPRGVRGLYDRKNATNQRSSLASGVFNQCKYMPEMPVHIICHSFRPVEMRSTISFFFLYSVLRLPNYSDSSDSPKAMEEISSADPFADVVSPFPAGVAI